MQNRGQRLKESLALLVLNYEEQTRKDDKENAVAMTELCPLGM